MISRCPVCAVPLCESGCECYAFPDGVLVSCHTLVRLMPIPAEEPG